MFVARKQQMILLLTENTIEYKKMQHTEWLKQYTLTDNQRKSLIDEKLMRAVQAHTVIKQREKVYGLR